MRMNVIGQSKAESCRHGAPASYPSSPTADPVGHHRSGDAIGVVLDRRVGQCPARPSLEVDPRLDAVRREVGHLGRRAPGSPSAVAENGSSAQSSSTYESASRKTSVTPYANATTAPTPAIDATRSPSSRRMMITPRVWRPEIRTCSSGMRITCPEVEITINSSDRSSTTRIPTISPIFGMAV